MSIDYGFLTPDEFGIFRDPDGHARAMDGRILQVSREDIADILQLANGPDNLFMQQRSIPDNIPAVPDEHPRADTTEIGSHQSCQPVGQTSIDRVYSASVDTHPHPAKRSYASIDTTAGTSIDIKAAAFEKEKGNIPIPSRFTNTYIRSFAPQITSHDTIAEKMNAPTNKSEGTSRKSIRSKNPNPTDKRLPSIDTPVSTSIDSHSKLKLSLFTKKNMSIDYGFLTPDEFGIFRDPDGHARAMDGTILQVSREDIADILQLANGPYNLLMQQRSIPDNIPAVPDEHPRADTTEIGSHQSCQPVGQTSIDKDAPRSFDRAPSPSIDRRYECERHAYDIYGARKFRWEQKDEYGVYRDES
ncbi:hypothetical protein F2Q68_00013319 [Brassica cretica]|uniref:Uncharacterized protein n=1 Tax=Brassica cretica TaxID=69181 RepID=A0A8S9HUV8_BRACR|nr:hypothetical protein F2Q68_00013319 [Brassica cretica]